MSEPSMGSGSPEQIEAAIAERRDRLAATVDELVAKAKPKAIAQRSLDDAKSRFAAATHTEDGQLRTEKLAAVGGAAAAALVLFVLLRRSVRRRRARRG